MSLNVKTRKGDGVLVVDMSGRLTIGEPVLLLRETLRVQVNDGVRQFVLNLGAGVQKNRFLRKLQFKVSPAQKIRQSRLKLVLRASLAGMENKWTFQKILYAFESHQTPRIGIIK